jgi:hypothetical protein
MEMGRMVRSTGFRENTNDDSENRDISGMTVPPQTDRKTIILPSEITIRSP